MKIVSAALSALILASEVSAAVDAATKRYRAAMEECASDYVLQLDDHISSADIVGRAIFDQCKGEHFDLWEAFAKRKNPSYVDGYEDAQLKWMIGIVLRVRAQASESNDAASKSGEGPTYNSSDGHEYAGTCNTNGFKLVSRFPVSRPSGIGADTQINSAVETIYLGANCDAFHEQAGVGKWCWANGGFLAEFSGIDIGFPRQELYCSDNEDLGTKCRC